jgi:dTDP-4-amino-4,6-dideoxygalactose transaminase
MAEVKPAAAVETPAEPFLPFSLPEIGQAEIDEVADTLRSGWLTNGPKVRAFEAGFREATASSHAVALSSCTAGLHLALLALGIGPGDEVITTPLTFAATVSMVIHTGATPVLADISEDDYNIDPKEIERHITPRTKAIIPVHYAGQPCRMDEILSLAEAHGLRVIEDAAHALGASYRGRPIGAIGDCAIFSFYPIKPITTGQGGMLTTDNEELADRVRLLSLHGLSKNAWDRYSDKGSAFYQVLAPGFNYVMTDIQAAIGIHQMRRLSEFQSRRVEIVREYGEQLADLPEIIRPARRDDVEHCWHLYAIRVDAQRLKIGRDEFIDELRTRGIGTSVHFVPIHYHPYFRDKLGLHVGDFPEAERVFEGLISLPVYPRMQEADVARVSNAIHQIVAANRR